MSAHPLPGPLPPGERILWRGAPDWRALAMDALHLRGLAIYLAVLVAAVAVAAILRGATPAEAALDTARASLVASIPLLLALAYAWAAARNATYTITDRRIIIRMGVALTMTMNLPFAQIAAANLRKRSRGTGEIRIDATSKDHLSWMVLWPHARTFRPAPILRALKDADRAGQILARALAASAESPIPLAPEARTDDNRREGHTATMAA